MRRVKASDCVNTMSSHKGFVSSKFQWGDRVQSVLAISRRYLAFWLATITPNLVADDIRPKLVRYQEELVDLLDALYGEGSTQPTTAPGEPSLTTLSQRLSAIIAEMRVTREALLASQRRTDEKIAEQDVRLSTVEGLLNERLTTLAGQLDETQQRLLDQVKITAAQQSVIRLAIEQLGKRYETRTGKIYDRLHARSALNWGHHAMMHCPLGIIGRRSTRCATARWRIFPDECGCPPAAAGELDLMVEHNQY